MDDSLGKQGEKLLKDNLASDEKIIVKLKGTFKEALVVTDKKAYVLKWGFMTGNTFGGRCVAFNFSDITGVEFKKHFATGYVEVLTPSTQNTQKSYWAKSNSGNSSLKADNIVNFQRNKFDVFQKAVKITREEIGKVKTSASVASNGLEDLEKLADLKNKGIISEQDFEAKKKQILGL